MTSTHLKIETISHSASEFETEVGVDDINKVEETRPDEIEIIEGQSPTNANHLEVKKTNKRSSLLFSLVCIISATAVMTIFSIERKSTNSNQISTEELNKSDSGCAYWHVTNDQICDDEANIEECQFDLGDCCDYQNDFSLCEDCFCHTKTSIVNESIQNCKVDQKQWFNWYGYLGDGICQVDLNNPQNFFDAGDCCLNFTQCDRPVDATMITDVIIGDNIIIDCPEHICVKSNVFCNQELMGDGICHDNNNSILCDFDLGDCCVPDKIEDSCCVCICHFIK